jgi:geranyl-CoA carboxylase alpha subunit
MRSLLIANRGEIARRIMRTARRMGLRSIAVYSDADRDALHVREADAAAHIGGTAPRESYLNIAAIIDAARRTSADAVHPGYGFLAENADFAQAVIDAGLTWVGPPPAAIRQMGDKGAAKRIARDAGVPTIPGYDADQSDDAFSEAANGIGYPVMIKAAAGGGGRGVRRVADAGELAAALDGARSEAQHAFGDGRLFLERALPGGRRRPARGARCRGDRACARRQLRGRRHHRVSARWRRLLLPGNEHAPSGRASGDRNDHRL